MDGALEACRQDTPRWRRAAAWGVDAALLAAAAGPPLVLAGHMLPAGAPLEALAPSAAGFAALLAFVHAALGHALMGATLGKRLLGLRVVRPDGTMPGLARSAARAALALLGTAALGAGVLPSLFTCSGRGLHDLAADTVVVRTP